MYIRLPVAVGWILDSFLLQKVEYIKNRQICLDIWKLMSNFAENLKARL